MKIDKNKLIILEVKKVTFMVIKNIYIIYLEYNML